MKTLYFYSHNDGVIRHTSVKTNEQVVSIINEVYDERFLRFLSFRTSILDQYGFEKYLNNISSRTIRDLLDAAGYQDKFVTNGVELKKLLFKDISNLFIIAQQDGFILSYLKWLLKNYLKMFNHHFGELILIVSNKDDISYLPKGFKPITFKPDRRVFYSKQNQVNTRLITQECGIKTKTAKILTFSLNNFVIVLAHVFIQSSGFFVNFVDF